MANIESKFVDIILNDEFFKSHVKSKSISVNKNEKILKKNATYPYFYVLIKGTVWVVLSDDTAKNVNPIVSEINQNEIFGGMGAFANVPANADVIAVTPVEIVQIDTESFFKFIHENPEFGNKILFEYIKTLIARINRLNDKVFSLLQQGIDLQKKK